MNGWVNVEAGTRVNTNPTMSPALVVLAQVGMTFFGWFQAQLYFPIYEPFFQPVVETNIIGVGQTRYFGFGARVSARFIDDLAVYFALDGVFYASSNAATPALQLGLESRFSVVPNPD